MSEAAYHAAVENRDACASSAVRGLPARFATGAKNSALKLMAAALLAEGTTTLTEVLEILDVDTMAELGADWDARSSGSGTSVRINVPERPDIKPTTTSHVACARPSACSDRLRRPRR